MRRKWSLLTANAMLLLASCAGNEDFESESLSNPIGLAAVELRDLGEGKQLLLHHSNDSKTSGWRVLDFEVCKDVRVFWEGDHVIVVQFDELEASYMNTFPKDGYDIVLRNETTTSKGAPDGRAIRVRGCY